MGVVVAAGPGKKDEDMKVAVGDKVVYFKYAGDKMTVRGCPDPRSAPPTGAVLVLASRAMGGRCRARLRSRPPVPHLRRTSPHTRRDAARSLARQDDKGTEYVVLHQNDILGKL